ncbi:MAG: SdrD B-like domain-containing protein, partial [Actinomycetota bacterium]
VDFDGDGNPDQVDTDYDEVGDAPFFTANAFDSIRVTDHNDRDMTGARVYTTDGTLISTAWGQDVAEGECCDAFDLGSAVLPSTSLVTTKTARLVGDLNSDGVVNPGDTLEYTVRSVDAGALSLTNVLFVDTLPTTLTYVEDSTTLDGAPVPDDTVGATAFPVDEAGVSLAVLAPGAAAILTFRATLVNPFPLFTQNVRNDVSVTADQANSTATAITPVQIPDLYLAKNGPTTPLLPGQQFDYTLDVSNISVSPQTGIDVTDALPAEVDWVSTTVTRPIDDPGPGGSDTIVETWNTPSYANDSGDWVTDWIETDAEGAGSGGGDVAVVSELGSNRLRLRDTGSEIRRTFDATNWDKAIVDFDWRREDFEGGEEVEFQVSTTNGSTWTTLDTFAGPATDVGYVNTTYDLTRYVGHEIVLRFVNNTVMNDFDEFFVDDLRLEVDQRVLQTVAGGAPPALYTGGELLTGESLTVTVTVTVDDPIDPTIDSFDNTASAVSAQNLSPVTSTATVDVARASIGDTVWHDLDGDGVVDAGEPRLSGVTVELLDVNGVAVTTDVTDGSGQYLFDELDPGDYTVDVLSGVPAGMVPIDDADGGRDETTDVTVAFGEDNTTTDFAYATPVTVGDSVFADLDGDGVENGMDFGIDGLTVTITGTSTNASHPSGTTTTTSAGAYSFTNLRPGTYDITVNTSPLSAAAFATTTANSQAGDTQTITVTSGNDDLTGDFGYVVPAAIGDLVWHDLDADGVRDAGEPAMGGVTVTATGPGLPVGGISRTTDANGYYLFADLDPGTFTITVSPSTGDLPTGYDSSTGGYSKTVTVATDELVDTADFGFYTQASIGDVVFEDVNGSASEDAGDQGLDAIDVTITGTTAGASHTGGLTQQTVNGAYDFTGLEPGTYTIDVDTSSFPSGTITTVGDGDATPSSRTITVRSTDDVDTADFGYLFPASIGDLVWHDLDGDGTRDAGEPGLAGAEITLTGTGLPPAGITETTGAAGAYAFSNLAPGTYTATLTDLPVGYVQTSAAPSFTFTVDSDDMVDTADFGAATTADIGDLVWHDLDADGTYDFGEPVFDNVTVRVSGGGLAAPIDVVTGSGALAGGEYRFADLDPGTYTVEILSGLPGGSTWTSTTGGTSRSVVLVSDVDQLDIDFGFRTTATVGDRVYEDLNGDGDQDAGEPGLGNVTLTLSQGATVVTTVDSDANGDYDFTGVAPGTYDVTIDTADVATEIGTGAVVVEGNGGYSSITVVSGEDRNDIDFGAYAPAAIGDRLWDDLDGDGVQDAGETSGFGGVTVTLTGPGLPVGGITDVTDANGGYGFAGLAPGDYTVTITATDLPSGVVNTLGGSSQTTTIGSGEVANDIDFGWHRPSTIGDLVWHDLDGDGTRDPGEPGIDGVTVDLSGSATATQDTVAGAYDFTGVAPGVYSVAVDTADLDVNPISTTGGFTQTGVAITSGTDEDDADFGVRYPASIGDTVFTDTDGDGDQDAGETGIGGITITITGTSPGASHSGGSTTTTATTGTVGSYSFGNLAPGTYDVTVDAGDTDLPVGATNSNNTTRTITVVSQQDVDTADFGFFVPATIGDRVFDDANGDGDDESGADAGLAGVTLELRDGATVVDTFTTTATGAYDFTGVAPGTYDVVVTSVPAGYTNSLGGTSQTVTVGSGDDENDVDFGYYLSASIGDRVFEDANGDGDDESGADAGLAGVTLELRQGATVVDTVTTTASGAYDFTGLAPGTYDVVVTATPAGVVNTLGGSSQTFTVASGDDQDDADFGYFVPASIGDLVWNDLDGDGVRDVGEPGIDGVTVSISGVTSDSTAAGGVYSLTGLAPGTYTVAVDTADLPAGAASSTGGFSEVVTVASGANRLDIDFGVTIPATIGDLVYLDENGNGSFDAGTDAPLSGVVVRLEGPGLPVGGITDTTDGAGDYTFTGLAPGSYTATIVSGLAAGAFSTTGGAAQTTTLTSGENEDQIDFGYAVPASIGDRVWNDLNGDGSQDDGTSGVSGVDVTITGITPGASHPTGSTTTTGADGAYLFSGLNPGTYEIEIDPGTLPSGESWSSTTGGRTQTVSISSGDNVDTADFGEVAAGSIGDFVFEDDNADGAQSGDAGLENIVVTLTGPGLPVGGITDSTDAGGTYGFTGLAPGTYTVTLTSGLPTGATSTTGGNTRTVTLTSGLDVDTADFGLAVPATIGDEVFVDTNGDGDRDAGEPGLPGVTIELRSGAAVVDTATSTAAGYDFAGVAPGTYDVVVIGGLPTGAVNTLGGSSQTVTVGSGDDENDVDFGWYVPASIGDLVFEDLNGNGVFDTGEPGFDGVTVTLSGAASATQDAVNGAFDFGGLVPGTYTVTVDTADLPAGVVNTLGGVSQTFTVGSGDDENGADFGYFEPASVGDLVWNDLDGDGVRDVGEPGLDGVTVSISGVASDDTAAGGAYSLVGLAPGTYTVEVDTADLSAGAASSTGGFTQSVTVASGDTDLDVDFGVTIPATIGDLVFQDSNGNGVQDLGEVGIGGVDVTITGPSHPAGTTIQTGTDGAYSFTGLLPGDYTVVVDGAGLPAGAFFTTAGGDTQTTTLTSGENEDAVDFGYAVPSTIGDRVFVDDNANGTFDAGDTGIDEVTVTLTGITPGASHTAGTTLTTSGGGLYDFSALNPGTYTVVLDTADTDFTGALGSTFTSTTGGVSLTITVGSATDENDADFGWYAPATIGDRVWDDLDADGNQDDGATGIAGLDVTIVGPSHPGAGTTIQTGTDGAYSFGGLTPGEYTITVTPPASAVATTGGFTRTLTVGSGDDVDTVDVGLYMPATIGDLVFHDVDGDGSFNGTDTGRTGVDVTIVGPSHPGAGTTVQTDGSGNYSFGGLAPGEYTITVDSADLPAGAVSTTGGFSQTVTVESGQDLDTVDFGDAVPATVGDRLFDDIDGDGIDDGIGLDGAFAGVDVMITGGALPAAGLTVQTDADGVYSFSGLEPGTYTVTVDTADLPAGVVNTLGGTSQSVTVTSGQDLDTVDFGWYRPASIGDLVWTDANGNATQNVGEFGLAGVEVTLSGDATGTDVTDGSGAYDFTGLAPGTYTITLTDGIPAGHTSTTGANTVTVTVQSGDSIDDVDFGLADFVTIGDRVWEDLDADGTQDAGETDGIENVQLELVDITNTVVDTATTDAAGAYSFTNVRPGTYTVRVVAGTAPTGFTATTSESQVVNATSGVDVLTVDVGYRTTGSIGDLVWDDLNGNRVFDGATESGQDGVTVTLRDSGNNVVDTVTTSGGGAYVFTDVEPGDYTVTITVPTNATVTTTGGATRSVTVLSGAAETDVDFGLAVDASIGDLIWHDVDASGDVGGSEAGIGGVLVQLRDDGGNVIASDTTDGNGAYAFTGLTPGDYSVTIDATTLPVGAVSGTRYSATTADTHSFTVESGDAITDADTGYATTAVVEGTVFEDDDASGSLDLAEGGLTGIDVELVDDGGNVVASDTTDGSGAYAFTGVPPGDYTVRVVGSTVPAGFSPTSPTSVSVSPESDERITDIDVGYVRPSTIGDTIWHDLDADGTADAGEPGLDGITVELVDDGGNVVDTEVTAGGGTYAFGNVAPGDYTVRVDTATLPTGVNSGTQFVASSGVPTSRLYTITSGDSITDADFAFHTTATIGDLVWHDLDADGSFDSVTEPGLGTVTVELVDVTNSVVTTATNGTGGFTFSGVAPGTYTVRLDRTTLPGGYSSTTGNDPTTITVVSDDLRDDIDFGEALLTGGLIGDRVFDDLNGNGVDDGEPGLDGVTVELLDAANAVVATRTTTGGGGYSFANLAPGAYTVRVDGSTVPARYVSSTGGLTQSTTLLSGTIDRDRDFGFVAPATVGDLVWHDLDGDGVQDGGEPGLGGVTVELRDGGNNVIAADTTAADGSYSIDVAPGTYSVVLDPTTIPSGANSGIAMTATSAPGGSITVVSNDAVTTADFGLATTARIGDTIFDDLNGDGD